MWLTLEICNAFARSVVVVQHGINALISRLQISGRHAQSLQRRAYFSCRSRFIRTLRFDLSLRRLGEETSRHHAALRKRFPFDRTICFTRVRATIRRLFDWNCGSLFRWLFDAEGRGGVCLHGATAGNVAGEGGSGEE